MTKRALTLLLLSLLVAVLLVACGAPQEVVEPTQAPTAEPTEVMVPFEALPALMTEPCTGAFKEIAAVDQYTVRFTTCNPDPAFLSKIAFSAFAIYPEEYLNATGGTGDMLEKPIGTGPYLLESWERGSSIIFTRNESYWGEKAIAPKLVFRWNSEASARLVELQSGQVDGIDNPSPDDFESIQADSSLMLMKRPALNTFYIGMTNTFAPWDEVAVRQAIAMGIDRQRIVDTFYPAGSEVATHFTPCAIANGCAGDAWYDYNPDKARELLAQAGLQDGFKTKLYYRDVVRGYLPEPGVVAQDIQAQLKDLGIEVEIEVQESGTFLDNASNGRLDGLYLLGWGADYPHITNFLDFHFGAAGQRFGTPFPEIYEQLQAGAQIADAAAAEDIYIKANNAIRELVPMVPVAHGGSATAYRADVEGGQASPLTNEVFSVVNPGGRDTMVWMQNAEPLSFFCADESDGESLRACEQVQEALYGYEVGGTAPVPALATACTPSEDLTVWTCALRQGVMFHDGSEFDANDVLATFKAGLDYTDPNHKGNTGTFDYYANLWGIINAPAQP